MLAITQRSEQLTTAATFTSFDNILTDAVVVTVDVNDTHQSVNGSFCCIVSLEVYRGRGQITEISHDGFSLSDRGTIEVSQIQVFVIMFTCKGGVFLIWF